VLEVVAVVMRCHMMLLLLLLLTMMTAMLRLGNDDKGDDPPPPWHPLGGADAGGGAGQHGGQHGQGLPLRSPRHSCGAGMVDSRFRVHIPSDLVPHSHQLTWSHIQNRRTGQHGG
jgi:hypothetical protein